MKAIIKNTVLVAVYLLFTATKSHAQFYKDMSIGLNGGAYIYQGDLSPQRFGSFKTIQPGISVFVKKPINHFLAARVHISLARLVGDESRYSIPEYRKQRNFYFSSPVAEFSGQLVWNIRGRNYEDRGIMPYIFSGAGVSLLAVKKDYSRMDPVIFNDGSEVVAGLVVDNLHGTPRAVLAVPIGVGAEYPISERFSVNIETSYRLIFTDYLDGFSQSAGPKYQDHYHSTSAGIIYKFGARNKNKELGCPVVRL
ncbi:MAG: DUF6089 family protein [Ferruginibacter sp.]|mgnify:FL=1|nr:hypothetical protein [Bacteroidota bacterium]MBX2918216.1 hypothetical protein [Ferruginibacter sp.]